MAPEDTRHSLLPSLDFPRRLQAKVPPCMHSQALSRVHGILTLPSILQCLSLNLLGTCRLYFFHACTPRHCQGTHGTLRLFNVYMTLPSPSCQIFRHSHHLSGTLRHSQSPHVTFTHRMASLDTSRYSRGLPGSNRYLYSFPRYFCLSLYCFHNL